MFFRLKYRLVFVSLLGLALVTPVTADSWSYAKEKKDQKYEFADTTIILTIDATENQKFPVFILDVKRGDILLARYRNIAFDQVFASEDNSVFVGLSNDGLPGTAIVVFDNQGNLRLEIKHHFANLDYCQESITRERVWYDGDNPAFKFKFAENSKSLQDMFVNDCHGQRISLFTLIDNIYKRKLNDN